MAVDDATFDGLFPILGQMVFFNHAGVAPVSGPAAEALRAYAGQAERSAYVGAGWFRRLDAVRQAVGRLIGARGPHEIAFVPNTTTGLAMVANGLDFQPGDHVVITNVEYPANRYPWENLRRKGVELIEVAQQPDGRIYAQDVCAAITDRTRVVSMSHVQFASGHRVDLAPISSTVHASGGYLCVDGIQSVGSMAVDVQALGIDFLAADGHKWMLGPEGAGIFYCHEDLTRLLHPTVVGWMNMIDAEDYGNYRFELLPDARRFEPATYNVAGILALGASIDLLLEIGLDKVWSRIDTLTACLCRGLEEKGFRVFSPRREESERSAIVTFESPAPAHAIPKAVNESTAAYQRIVADLARQNIVIALREGRLRASPHFYNTADQIDRLLDALPAV